MSISSSEMCKNHLLNLLFMVLAQECKQITTSIDYFMILINNLASIYFTSAFFNSFAIPK